MTPIFVEPLSEQAYELLRQLEALHILRVAKPEKPLVTAAPRKWAGALAAVSPTSAAEWDEHLQALRDEWDRHI